jgi:hypothetical protein
MTKQITTRIARTMQATGMTNAETRDYLEARGIQYSIGAVHAWARGTYHPPEMVFDELEKLALCTVDESLEMPSEAPASVRSRRLVIATCRRRHASRLAGNPPEYSWDASI